jgi:hypothetical protein
MFTLRADQHTRKRRGVSGTNMPAVRADDSGEHERDYRRREDGRKRTRSFPLFRVSGRDLPRAGPPPALVRRKKDARCGSPPRVVSLCVSQL